MKVLEENRWVSSEAGGLWGKCGFSVLSACQVTISLFDVCVFAGSSSKGGEEGGPVGREGHVYVSQSDGVDSCWYKFCVCDLQICVKVSQGFS